MSSQRQRTGNPGTARRRRKRHHGRKAKDMSAAKKLNRAEAYLETGMVTQAGAAGEMRGDHAIEVRLATGTFKAARAKSCLVAPEVGDKVLCAVDDEGVYITAVLAGQDGAATTIAADGDLRLQARSGRVSVCGSAGVDLVSGGAVGVTGSAVHVRAKEGSVAVEELGFFGRLVQAEVAKVALVAQEVDSIVTRLSQRAKRVFRFVEEIDQTRAGTVDMRAQTLLGLRAENAVLSARVLAKVDGEQIHIG
jgi:hypothetical protein